MQSYSSPSKTKSAYFFFTNNRTVSNYNQATKSSKALNISLENQEQNLQKQTQKCLKIEQPDVENPDEKNLRRIKYRNEEGIQQKNIETQSHNDSMSVYKNQFVTRDFFRSNRTSHIITENLKLKQQNLRLRKQVQMLRNQEHNHRNLLFKQIRSNNNSLSPKSHSSSQQRSNDLRGTVKKQQQTVKQYRNKLDVLSKQCKMYEEIIDNMQCTIRKLTDQNRRLNNDNKKYIREIKVTGSNVQNNSAMNDHQSHGLNSRKIEETTTDCCILQGHHNGPGCDVESSGREKECLKLLKEKVNMVIKEYSKLESKMHSSQLEWVIWKQQWITEKNIYLNKIKQLENKLIQKDMNNTAF